MENLYVYADFDFLPKAEKIGVLSCQQVRGKDHFTFTFSDEWLSNHGDTLLSGDIMNVKGVQHPRQGQSVFGFVGDSFPDRWGRLLLDRRERLAAQEERRPVKLLSNYDYLFGIEDFTRMGGIRYSTQEGGSFINSEKTYCVPPLENLSALCNACAEIEWAEERGELPQERWLNLLVDPGSSLGGARPKANVVDKDGKLYVAKFPSRMDTDNLELIEHFSHLMAAKAGIDTAHTQVIGISRNKDVLLSERFDRTADGRRIHFASAMALLGLTDGSGAGTGNGYIDMVDFIVKNCTDVQNNLRELFRRVAFNILYGNTDDHFRNHGFLLTRKGWTLAPAYDINPSGKKHQCLLINENTEVSDIHVLLDSCESYMLERKEAKGIIDEVSAALKDWRSVAQANHIPVKVPERWMTQALAEVTGLTT